MTKYSIQIPEPCSEDWNQMTPLAKGRHCAVCQKTIYDFSNYTEDALVQHLQREGKICGRIPTKYLDVALGESKANRSIGMKGIVAAAINLLLLTTTAAVQGQEKEKIEQHVKEKESLPVMEQQPIEKKFVVVRGKVMDEDGIGLPGAGVRIKGTQLGVGTDMNGNFELKVPEDCSTKQKVEFQFIGMKTKTLKLKDLIKRVDVVLEEDDAVLGEVLIEKKKKRGWFF